MFRACLVFLISNFLFSQIVLAETLESNSYRIRLGNFNMTSGGKSSATYSLTDTVGQTAAGLFSSSGYAVLAGFQYIYTLYDFAFAISDYTINLGTLLPNTLASDSHLLTISAPGQGYTVATYEIKRLSSGSNYINDTTCDISCDESIAGIWTDTNTFGFGYNASGDDVPATFAGSSYFRPFPDLSFAESPAIVMSSTDAGENRVATITYQANISSSQAAGNYTTEIIFIATPVY